MIGHSEQTSLADVLWADAEIQSVTADYSELRIALKESTCRTRTIRCCGHIGYSAVGIWDEVIVDRAEVVTADALLDECRRSLHARCGQSLPDTGSPWRNQQDWKVLRIHLSDGCLLRVVAAEFMSE